MAADPDHPAPAGPSLARSSVVLLTARISSNAGFFVAVLLIARSLSQAQRGSFAFVSVGGLLLGTLSSLGVGSALAVAAARDPARRPELVTAAVIWGAATGLVSSAVVVLAAVALGTGALPAGVDVGVLGWVAAAAVASSAGGVVALVHQGSGIFAPQAAVTGTAPWVYCGILGVARLSGSLDFEMAVAGWAAYWMVWTLGTLLVARRFVGYGRLRLRTIAESLSFGLRAWIGEISVRLNQRVDQVLMGFIAAEVTLGVYAVAVNLAEVLLYIPDVVGFALLPMIARSAKRDRRATTLGAARALLVVSAVTGVVAAVIGPPLLPLLFGSAYGVSATPFLLLIPGAFGFALISTFSNALTASGAPGRSSSGPLASLVVGIALDLALIPSLGANGAAIAASCAFLAGGVVAATAYRRIDRFPLGDLVPRRADLGLLTGAVRTVVAGRRAG